MVTTYAHLMRQVSRPAAAGDTAQPSMPPGNDAAAGFGVIVAGLQAQRDQLGGLRPELVFEDVPAPRTLAPYASAMAATVLVGDEEIARGRLILLYDPAGQTRWAGAGRGIAYIHAHLD